MWKTACTCVAARPAGHKRKDVDDYSHMTDVMISRTLEQLQRRWEEDGGSWIMEGLDEAV
ncbi:hypothetical protein [Lentzea guizhouensis]|uniref:hypothetical protein n=1 Tax=Lentzea guizhouensis TaxID=1586287 RepID=UPI0012B68143|nr:hypothetical protein [Lentzea guizhouensis]